MQQTSERLKQASYPGREGDVDWLMQLKAEAARRSNLKQPAAVTPPKPAAPPKPPPRDPVAERAAAVAQANAALAQMDQNSKAEEEEEPAVTPMALSDSKYAAKPAAKVPAKRANRKAPDPAMARFLPGGFTNDDIYKDSDAAMKRIDDQIAKDREISKTPYEERLQDVRVKLQKKMDVELSETKPLAE